MTRHGSAELRLAGIGQDERGTVKVIAGDRFEAGDENLRDGPEADAADQQPTCFRASAGNGFIRFDDVPGNTVHHTDRNGDQS